MTHIKENQILTENHHGRLPKHSTITAKAIIDYYGTKATDQDKTGIVLNTG